LIGMVERASLIHANIEFESQPGKGTKVKLRYSDEANSIVDNKPVRPKDHTI
jgi:nitrate/nitrite-specific signal transduction histidine kinase